MRSKSICHCEVRSNLVDLRHVNAFAPMHREEIASYLAMTSGRKKIISEFLTYFFFFLAMAFASPVFAQKADSVQKVYRLTDLASNLPTKPLYIIDDEPIADTLSTEALKKIDPNEILELTILKDGPGAQALYGTRGAMGVIIITTKGYGKKKYQEKLSAFSKDYQHYLHGLLKSGDDDCFYLVDGAAIDPQNDTEMIRKLYDLPKEKIKTVEFFDKFYKDMMNNRKPAIVITTK